MNPAYRPNQPMNAPIYPTYPPMMAPGTHFPFPHPQGMFMAPPNYQMPYGSWPYMMPGGIQANDTQPQALMPNFVPPGSFAPPLPHPHPMMHMGYAPYHMAAPQLMPSESIDGRSLKVKQTRSNSDQQQQY